MKEKYKVNTFIQNNSPLTLGYDKLSSTTDLSFTAEDFKNTTNAWYKWFQLNAEEGVFDYLDAHKSKYLIMNVIESFLYLGTKSYE